MAMKLQEKYQRRQQRRHNNWNNQTTNNNNNNDINNNNGTNTNNDDDSQQSFVPIDKFIPPYLRRFITPYRGDFCFTRMYHYQLLAQLMMEGFLPIATEGYLLPKLHLNRCVISLPQNLHISKSVRKKSKQFAITINHSFDQVVSGCKQQHGRKCWLYPPLVEGFLGIHQAGCVNAVVFNTDTTNTNANSTTATRNPHSQKYAPVRLYSIEIWNEATGALAGGELGYTVGSIYTSLTGFSSEDSAGSVQLAALGRLLCTSGFSTWDLGMEMDYKKSLGCHLMPRKQFVDHIHSVRESMGHLVLPTTTSNTTTTNNNNNSNNANSGAPRGYNAKSLIDQTIPLPILFGTAPCTKSEDCTKKSTQENGENSKGHRQPPAFDPERSPPHRKKQRNTVRQGNRN